MREDEDEVVEIDVSNILLALRCRPSSTVSPSDIVRVVAIMIDLVHPSVEAATTIQERRMLGAFILEQCLKPEVIIQEQPTPEATQGFTLKRKET
jgi:hypothetical protein